MEIVNGYVCRTCCDVDLAKKGIDPAHPHDGPNGLEPRTPPAQWHGGHGPAVKLDGALKAHGAETGRKAASAPTDLRPGARLHVAA